jgi:hypothetical protein
MLKLIYNGLIAGCLAVKRNDAKSCEMAIVAKKGHLLIFVCWIAAIHLHDLFFLYFAITLSFLQCSYEFILYKHASNKVYVK